MPFVFNLYDLAYGLGVAIAAPYWLLKPSARRKVLRAFCLRMGRMPSRNSTARAVMIHAVSLGEMNATRSLVDQLSTEDPELEFIISATTETGWEAGERLYGGHKRVSLVRFPLDFSSAIERLLDATRPSLVVLMELEVWPNFMLRCWRRGIAVMLVNARVTPHSFARYQRGGVLTRRMFARLAGVCAQDKTYAQRFVELGCHAENVQVTGTMKFDTAAIADRVDGDTELAAAMGLCAAEPLWVCASTGPGEEALILPIYRSLRNTFPALRLAIIPRKPERFDEVAELVGQSGFALVRRSGRPAPAGGQTPAVLLGDTMGELRKFYSLAMVVFVGRTLVDLGSRQHGSDMMEPAALGKPVIVGPYTANFAEVMNQFRAADAMREVVDASQLQLAVQSLLADPPTAVAFGTRARQVVHSQKGATARNVGMIVKRMQQTIVNPKSD